MRAGTLFALLCLVAVAKSDGPNNYNKLLELAVKFAVKIVEKSLNKVGNITFVDKPKTVDVTIENYLEGSLYCNNATFYGLSGLSLPINVTSNVATKESGDLLLNLNIIVSDQIGFEVENYTADVGIVNYVPLYGTNGSIRLGMTKFKLKISTNITWNNSKISFNNFQLRPTFYLAKVNITQFFNNPEFSSAISKVLELLIDAGQLFWYAEEKCISCGVSSVIESVLNGKIKSFWNNFLSECKATCFPTQSAFVTAAFQTDVANLNQKDLINYIEIAIEKFVAFTENHLGI